MATDLIPPENVMRVSGSTPSQAIANSIRMLLFEEGRLPVIRAVGAGAVAQVCKGIAIARGIVAVRGVDLAVSIGFDNIPGDDGKEISAQTFHLFLR